ncbi:MAG: NUDIX hydrolase [Halobacterium sp.]
MPVAGTEQRVERLLAGLEREFGSFDVTVEETVVPRSAFTDCLRAAESGTLGGVRAFVRRGGDVLLVRYDADPEVWDLPGGSTARVESYAETARSRVLEDAGVRCEPTGVVRVTRQTFALVEGGDGVTGLWVFFEADVDDGELEAGDHVSEVAWYDADDLPDAVAPEVADELE